MKFMKLGSRPDTFSTTEAVRSVNSEVSSDLIVQLKGYKYLLHKFPLLSKCLKLQRLCSECCESSPQQAVQLPDFPGGIEAFELCAKFCYGITITLSAHNFVAVRCAAEYLQMMEDAEKGNLIYKLEIFFSSCILNGWRDTIVALQSTKALASWAEDVGVTSRCVEALASKVTANPSKVNLSRSCSRRGRDDASCNVSKSQKHKATDKSWWAEDLAELSRDLYWRTMIAIKSDGKAPSDLIGDALKVFASRWLPNVSKCKKADGRVDHVQDSESSGEVTSKHRLVLESIVSLLPAEKGAVSCSFLLKLLKAANILKAASSKMELARRVGIQLEEATVGDLLIPSLSYTSDTLYDVDTVIIILEQFMLQGQSPPTSPPRTRAKGGVFERRRSRSAENVDFEFQESRRSSSASHGSKLKVAKLIDNYLQEIARDGNLPMSKFISIAEAIPEFSRLDHDDLYMAIDIYLKAHPELNKTERKRLCRILDCKKLSKEACMHAAQNELLPLRVVVQVLFFEQARVAMSNAQLTGLPNNIKALLAAHGDPSKSRASVNTNASAPADNHCSVSGLKSPKSKHCTLRMKLAADDEHEQNFPDAIGKSSRFKSRCMLPNRSGKIFSKLWPMDRSVSKKN